MSELKVYHHELRHNEYEEFYLKYEADKVIADLDESHKKEVGQLLILNREQANAANRLRDSMEQVIRHHKYKRCLAMAMWCFEKSYSTTLVKYDEKSGLLRNFYDWWGKRWLELAEKFKPNKSTAQ